VCAHARPARQAALKPVMGEDDVRGAYVWLQRLACNPYADNDSPVVIHGTPPGISAARASPVTSTPQSLCTHCACLSEHFVPSGQWLLLDVITWGLRVHLCTGTPR